MSFLKGFDKIVGKDDLRPALQNVVFKNGFAVATDSHKAVKVDLKLYELSEQDISNMEGYLIDLDALNELKLKKGQTLSFSKGVIKVNVSNRAKPLKTIELCTESDLGIKFPNVDAVMGAPETSISSISFNPKFFIDVENVYNSLPNVDTNNYLTTVFTKTPNGKFVAGMRVQNFDGSFEALIMPRLSGEYKDLSK